MDVNFTAFITKLVSELNLSNESVEYLTAPDSLEIYRIAFTHSSLDNVQASEEILHPRVNIYEHYEQIGDSIIKAFMSNYFYRRFPSLWNSIEGVKIVARLMIKYGSGEVLAEIADTCGFWPQIQITTGVSSAKRRIKILEDVFEAFIGATSIIIECKLKILGVGFVVCYKMLEGLFDRMKISLKYDELFDAKTRLKELIDVYKEKLGTIKYEATRNDQRTIVSIVQKTIQDTKEITVVIGLAEDVIKSKAEQLASEQALTYLKLKGFSKKVQKEYNDLIQ